MIAADIFLDGFFAAVAAVGFGAVSYLSRGCPGPPVF